MVIIRTRATEVSIQAVSPELGVHFVTTAGGELLGPAAAQAGGPAGAAGAGAAAGWSWALEGLGEAKPMNAAIANAGARLARTLVSFISLNSEFLIEWI